MLEKLKDESTLRKLSIIILLLVMALGLILAYFSYSRAMKREPVKFESLAPDEISKDLFVDVTLYDNFGCYMEEQGYSEKTKMTYTTGLYYVIWTGDDKADNYRYMGIKVPASDRQAMEDMAEATYYGYEYSDPIRYSGVIKKMAPEGYQYLTEYFEEGGLSADEIDGWLLPYYIDTDASAGSEATFGWLWVVFIAAFILLAVILRGNVISGNYR